MTSNNNHIEPNDCQRVAPASRRPTCDEDDIDSLVWIDNDRVRCASCGTIYDPNERDEAE